MKRRSDRQKLVLDFNPNGLFLVRPKTKKFPSITIGKKAATASNPVPKEKPMKYRRVEIRKAFKVIGAMKYQDEKCKINLIFEALALSLYRSVKERNPLYNPLWNPLWKALNRVRRATMRFQHATLFIAAKKSIRIHAR